MYNIPYLNGMYNIPFLKYKNGMYNINFWSSVFEKGKYIY